MDLQERQKQQRDRSIAIKRGHSVEDEAKAEQQPIAPTQTPGIPDYPIKVTLRAELEIVQIPSYTRRGKFIAGDAPKTPPLESTGKETLTIARPQYPEDTK